ncbi:hypothetical protein L2E82_26837 [Cichorium intybus]|uniref:Uncharacterized protein n=1 Tax=Cichorium intybus TaxID=13427 RepID=A0ACB9CRK6_CICIN|nr:hypothetical protein L2E82_26837 [Cichorium intybus]
MSGWFHNQGYLNSKPSEGAKSNSKSTILRACPLFRAISRLISSIVPDIHHDLTPIHISTTPIVDFSLSNSLAFIFPICQIALNSLLPLSVSLHLDIISSAATIYSLASTKSKVVSSCSIISGASLTLPLFPN